MRHVRKMKPTLPVLISHACYKKDKSRPEPTAPHPHNKSYGLMPHKQIANQDGTDLQKRGERKKRQIKYELR